MQGTRAASDADIKLLSLLGPDARLSNGIRTVILSRALGRGIDEWVFASADAIRRRLLAGIATQTATTNRDAMLVFFDFLTLGATPDGLAQSRPAKPEVLKPMHVEAYLAWLMKQEVAQGWARSTTRNAYQGTKSTLLAMFDLGLIKGEPHRFFRGEAIQQEGIGRTTSLSDAEQARLAAAVKADLSAIHHGRLKVTMRELQALRLLVVAHRMGHNTTPLLELARDAVKPGLLPGTIFVRTVKHRGKRANTQMARDESPVAVDSDRLNTSDDSAETRGTSASDNETGKPKLEHDYLPFRLAEAAVIGQAIASTEHLVGKAPMRLRNRVWLYEVSRNLGGKARKGDVSALSASTITQSNQALVKRHKLLGDDGKPMVINNSRLRKSRFDRAFRISDGDLAVTANLMGNTPSVAGANYPSMNVARQAEAAGFLNDEYIAMMLGASQLAPDRPAVGPDRLHDSMYVVEVTPVDELQASTPVAGCSDAWGGEHAPKNGSPCDRFVMCLFCANFAIVGTVNELWRLFSFQAFARAELAQLEQPLGHHTGDSERVDELQELRDRYRLAIPYIDSFTSKQFAASTVNRARNQTAAGLHPFWFAQLEASRRVSNAWVDAVDLSGANRAPRQDHGANGQLEGE